MTGSFTLQIRNNGFLDVAVYALPSSGIDTRIRITTATGHSDSHAVIPVHALRPGGVLVLYLHAIGSSNSWVSPSLLVDSDSDICLDIQANPDGGLSRSSLYLTPKAIATPENVTSLESNEVTVTAASPDATAPASLACAQ